MTKTILIIDDASDYRYLVKVVLENKGIKVLEASTGAQATEILGNQQLDLLIVDGLLPDTEGIDWIAAQRQAGITTPIAFVSGRHPDDASYKRLTDELKVGLVINKSVMPKVFAEQITNFLQSTAVVHGASAERKSNESETLSLLAKKYLVELPGRLDVISTAIAKAKNNPDPLLAADVRLSAHKLRGTAGSFGLQKLGDIMGSIEDQIRNYQTSGVGQTQLWTEIERLFNLATECVPAPGEDPVFSWSESKPVPAGHTAANVKILVVDDDHSVLKLVEEFGRQRLIEVIPANTGKEALAIAAVNSLDAAIIDVQLAEEDISFELAKQLRNLPGKEKLPLAFISASSHIYNRVAAAHAGASLYLTKPFGPDALEATVQQLIAVSRKEQPRILVVDDDQTFLDLIVPALESRNMTIYTLNDPVRILDALQEVNPELILLDIMMPGVSGLDVCKMLRTVPRWQNVPIIFLTAETGLETRVAVFQCGGDDYLPKPFVEEELFARVKLRIERSYLLREHAERDSITGLLLRRPFIEQFKSLLTLDKKQNLAISLAIIHIDDFETINETKGYLAGDNVLTGLGQLLTRRFKAEDLRGRWGGDEFIVAFHDISKEDVHGAVDHFISEFKSMSFPAETGQDFQASLSVGIAHFPGDGETIYDLIQTAQHRLRLAKSSGRNLVVSEV